MTIIFYVAIMLTMFLVIALFSAPIIFKPSATARRILEAVHSTRPDQREVGMNERIQDAVLDLGTKVRQRLAMGEDDSLRQKMSAAGLKAPRSISIYLGSRFFVPMVGVIGGSFVQTNTMFWALSLGAIGYLLPKHVALGEWPKSVER